MDTIGVSGGLGFERLEVDKKQNYFNTELSRFQELRGNHFCFSTCRPMCHCRRNYLQKYPLPQPRELQGTARSFPNPICTSLQPTQSLSSYSSKFPFPTHPFAPTFHPYPKHLQFHYFLSFQFYPWTSGHLIFIISNPYFHTLPCLCQRNDSDSKLPEF